MIYCRPVCSHHSRVGRVGTDGVSSHRQTRTAHGGGVTAGIRSVEWAMSGTIEGALS